MKWQDIKDIFRKEVGEVQYVEMFENPDGKSRGTGIIEFKDKDTARKAIEQMHRYKMKDRNIVVREERESDQNMGRGGGSGMMAGLGMMGNMGGGGMMGGMGGVNQQVLNQLGIDGPLSAYSFCIKLTWKKLKDVFKLAGNVRRAEIKEDKDGKSRGMGTVQFETVVESVQAICGLKSIGMGLGAGGQPLQNMGGGGGGSMGGMSGMGNMGSGMSSMGGMGMDSGMGLGGSMGGMNSMGGMSGGMGGSGMSGGGMGMGGIGGMGNSQMSGMGMSGGMNDGFSSMGSGGMGNSSFGGSGMGGMGDRMSGMGSGLGNNSFGMMDNMGLGSNYGGSGNSSFGSSDRMSGRDRDRGRDMGGRGQTRPDNCTVIVKNLPYAIKWQDLRDKFKEAGDVKFAEIKVENGRSQGWGLVRYGSPEDAQEAIDYFNRSKIEGREIDVKLYR
ncbi:hypothetical protein FSP39_023120 [Pinctada imbricata]|uniref:RRM domain-containing protein n=1 Tax=Pinctada imbricata TaxID=66713 RepID=A0AA89BY71_PINIB|nr:hypothetical protein FSP39_023120 [Pinctada imbricata]